MRIQWSSLRSAYASEANAEIAPQYVANGWYGPDWFGAGWYWNPWFACYTFLPADGLFYSPFGWGFYSPFVAFNYFGGYYGPHYHHRFAMNPHEWGPVHNTPVYRGGLHAMETTRALRGNPRAFSAPRAEGLHTEGSAGSFHGGAVGGFHSGGFGGFHRGGVHGPGR